MDKIKVTWEQMEKYIDKVIEITKDKQFTGVYGIPRGGVVLATLLSYKLHLPLLLAPTKGCIIIDDIADSGRTLMHFTENDTQFNKYYITTMYYKNRSLVTPDYYMYTKEDEWIVFPWEDENE